MERILKEITEKIEEYRRDITAVGSVSIKINIFKGAITGVDWQINIHRNANESASPKVETPA